jgi:hypothetical protein
MAQNVSLLGSVSFGWLNNVGGFQYDENYFLDPQHRLKQDEAVKAFLDERFPDDPIYNFEAHCVRAEGRQRPVALVGGIQVNLIMGAAVGAKFAFQPDKDMDITQTPLLVVSKRQLIELFAREAGFEIDGVHLGVCSACMIGPDQFAEFILPAVQNFGKLYGLVKIHSCGLSDHLTEMFAEIEGLNCLNVGSNTSVAKIRERIGNVHIDLIPDAQMLTFGTTPEIDRWTRQTVEENGDGELEFQYHMDLLQPEENCLQINKTIRELGYDCSRQEVF